MSDDSSDSGSALQDEEFHEWLRRHGLDKPHSADVNSGGYTTSNGIVTLPPGVTVNPAAIRGFTNQHVVYDDTYVDWTRYTPAQFFKPEPKCTCGVTITMGRDDSIVYHSDWCDVKEALKK